MQLLDPVKCSHPPDWSVMSDRLGLSSSCSFDCCRRHQTDKRSFGWRILAVRCRPYLRPRVRCCLFSIRVVSFTCFRPLDAGAGCHSPSEHPLAAVPSQPQLRRCRSQTAHQRCFSCWVAPAHRSMNATAPATTHHHHVLHASAPRRADVTGLGWLPESFLFRHREAKRGPSQTSQGCEELAVLAPPSSPHWRCACCSSPILLMSHDVRFAVFWRWNQRVFFWFVSQLPTCNFSASTPLVVVLFSCCLTSS